MPHDPRIEVFKIVLYRKNTNVARTFREFFRAKSGHYLGYNPPPSTDAQILSIHAGQFVEAIGLRSYRTDDKKKKAFTIAVDRTHKPPKTKVDIQTASQAIDGILIGGKYDAVRILAKVEDTEESNQIGKNNVVADQFYFLLWTPLNHHEGIAIIQGYSESRITDVVKKQIEKYFTYHKDWSCFTEIFVPKSYREKYAKGAAFHKAVFSSSYEVSEHDAETPVNRKQHKLQVKIEIIDKSPTKASKDYMKQIVGWLGQSKFKLPTGATKDLNDFDKIEAKMENDGKALSFNFDDEDDVTPSIILKDEGKYTNLDGSTNMQAIQTFCRNLLQEIAEELSPTNGIKEDM